MTIVKGNSHCVLCGAMPGNNVSRQGLSVCDAHADYCRTLPDDAEIEPKFDWLTGDSLTSSPAP